MKKKYALIICLFLFPKFVIANSINRIDMDIYVDNDGTAHVTETWTANLDSGTEGYKPYYNLGESNISNFKVSIDGINYSYVNDWNVNWDFNEKKYKNGFNYINNGVELCFGISKYGNNTYKLSYDISNFVLNTSDGYQMIYWTLFPYDYNPSSKRVYIKIYSDFGYDDSIGVWGYGKYGAPTRMKNGFIEMDSVGIVNSSEYMTILVKFPNNTFSSSVTLDKSFDEYLDMANDGAIFYTDNEEGTFDYFVLIFPISVFTFIIGFIILLIFLPKRYGSYKIKFGKDKCKIKNTPYFRDIPYNKDNLDIAYWYACQYNLVNNQTDYLGAILLKWIRLGNISLEKNRNNKNTVILFNNSFNLCDEEIKLYEMMYEASCDGRLEKKEFTSWCKLNYTKIYDWFNRVIDNITFKFLNNGYLTRINESYKCYANPIINEEAKKIIGLKKFLKDFSNIKDRSAIEVNLWDEYLMYAYIFGIAKMVMKEFRELYPDVISDDIYNDIDFVYLISSSGMNSAHNARSSSSGGGYSSSGGGGGSFGGGGGGGGFR